MKATSARAGPIVIGCCALAVFTSCGARGRSVTTKTGLEYRIVVAGSDPLKFLLGGDQVIAGVDEGVTGMRVGKRRTLIVPPALSVRSVYPAHTPPDATLYYDITLVAILAKQAPRGD